MIKRIAQTFVIAAALLGRAMGQDEDPAEKPNVKEPDAPIVAVEPISVKFYNTGNMFYSGATVQIKTSKGTSKGTFPKFTAEHPQPDLIVKNPGDMLNGYDITVISPVKGKKGYPFNVIHFAHLDRCTEESMLEIYLHVCGEPVSGMNNVAVAGVQGSSVGHRVGDHFYFAFPDQTAFPKNVEYDPKGVHAGSSTPYTPGFKPQPTQQQKPGLGGK